MRSMFTKERTAPLRATSLRMRRRCVERTVGDKLAAPPNRRNSLALGTNETPRASVRWTPLAQLAAALNRRKP